MKKSEFGKKLGAHGGICECPDLFLHQHNGENHWVLLVNINPGEPRRFSHTIFYRRF
ncbi:hypothetical protein ACFOWA_00870 [Pedobacter lithocola]|uniref:Uncharacterized protein n=1 Tax=Pedobacter lithocola TaxID=1908239 RepID=A0ABV8P4Z4_9SPHI